MQVRLLRMWHRHDAGKILELDGGVSDCLIRAGIAEDAFASRTSDGSDSRAADAKRSEKAARNRDQRHDARRAARTNDPRS